MAYSGGADSTALLHLLHQCGIDCVAAHLHHGMRPEADAELEECAKFADSLAIPFVSGRADVPAMAAQLKIGLEEAGRHARYTFLKQSAYRTNCDLIATGHTSDDNTETVLFNLARGTGTAGIAGIPPTRENIIRPLLPFRRSQTRDYCQQNQLWFHDDPANLDQNNRRVMIRQAVVPELLKINPELHHAISRTSQITRNEHEFLDRQAAGILEHAQIKLNGHLEFVSADVEAAFSTRVLAHAPPVLLARAVRLAFSFLSAEIDFDLTNLVCGLIRHGKKGSVTSPDEPVVLECDQDQTTIRRLDQAEPFRFPLTLPGETESPVFGWQITAESVPPSEFTTDRDSLSAIFDLSACKGGLHLRSNQPDDTMIPFGESQSRSINSLLASSKLTSAAKSRLPIICDMVGPVWIPGIRLAERVRITGQTQRAVRLRFEPFSPDRRS